MKIAALKLQNFRCYENAEVVFDQPLSIVRGQNHAGKSSLGQALQLSLTGQTDGTDPRGASANDKIKIGTSKALITTVIEGKSGALELRTSYGPGRTGRVQNIIASNGIVPSFEKYLEANKERLSCALNSDHFMNPKTDQKAVLAALVLPTSYTFDPKMVELAEQHLGPIDWNANPVRVIDLVYDMAYKARTQAKTVLGNIYIPATPRKPEYDAASVQDKLLALRAKAAKETKRKPGGTVQLGRLEQQLEQFKATISDCETLLEGAQSELGEIGAELLDSATYKKHQKTALGRREYIIIEKEIENAVREIQAQREAQAIYRELLEDKHCPTCTQSITADFVNKKIAFHQNLENKAAELQTDLLRQQKALGDIVGAEKAIQTHEAKAAEKTKLVAEIGDLTKKIAEISVRMQTVTADIEQAKADAAEPVDTHVLDALNTEIEKWEAQLVPSIQYESTLAQIEREEARAAMQRRTVADLETLCGYFGKDGVKAELIAAHIGAFEAIINGVLGTWGYAARLSMEPYSFDVTSAAGELPLKELSGSEKRMFAIALQCAIAIHARIGMVLIDAADIFINGERGRLFGCLKSLLDNGKLDQAIVLVSDERNDVPVQPGVGFYKVGAGKVQRL